MKLVDPDAQIMTLAFTLNTIEIIGISVHLSDGTLHTLTEEINENNEQIWSLPSQNTKYNFGTGINGLPVTGIVIILYGNEGESSLVNMDIEACIKQGKVPLLYTNKFET